MLLTGIPNMPRVPSFSSFILSGTLTDAILLGP